MAYAAPGAYGAAYPAHGYAQQQQHADPQAAAYAQYMQQVRQGEGGGGEGRGGCTACISARSGRVVTRAAVRFALCRLPPTGSGRAL